MLFYRGVSPLRVPVLWPAVWLTVQRLGTLLCAVTAVASCAQAQDPVATLTPTATATLRVSALRQPMYGFGGSQTYRGDALADYAGRERVYEALFGELKLDIYRLRNYHDYEGQQEKFEKITREFATAARRWSDPAKRGDKGPVRVLVTSWSPPARLKSNNSVRGKIPEDKEHTHATLKRLPNGQYVYNEFADWWLSSVEKFKQLSGVYPDYITIQNELDWAVEYDGCEFMPVEGADKDGHHFAGYDKALIAVHERLRNALGAQAPKILGPENFAIGLTTNMVGAPGAPNTPRAVLWADPTTPTGKAVIDRLFGISYHIYGSDAEPSSPRHERFHTALEGIANAYRPLNKPMFQTEFLGGSTLTELAKMIHDTLAIGEASSYFVWISGRTAREPGEGLVYYNPEDQSIERRERFYAMKHFSAFIGEGWNRVDAASSDPAVLLSTYIKSATRELVAVLINPTDRERRVVMVPEGDIYKGVPATIYRTMQGEAGERWRQLPLAADNVVTLPARSVATVKYAAPSRQAAPATPRYRGNASVPSPRGDANSKLAHEQLVAKAKAGGIDLYFLGDSITRRWGTSDPQWSKNLENWKQNFHGWNAGNFGWGADGIQNMLWRIQNGELEGANPKVIVILAGTNNVGNKPGGDEKVADIAEGIRALVDTCRQKAPGAKIIVTGITPRNDGPAITEEIGKINDQIAKFAADQTIFYLNINDKLSNPDGTPKEGVTIDGLHLSVMGYQVWADALKPLLTQLLGPPAATDHAPPPTGDPSAQPASTQGINEPQNVPPLKDAFKGKFLIGTAVSTHVLEGRDPATAALIGRHYDALTAENAMKPDALQPREGQFNFATADRLVEMAEKSGATVIGHTLLWHAQTPRWFFEGPKGQPANRELALARMRTHIKTVVGRYKGRVKQWDVVNEAINDGPGVLRPSPWLSAIGDDFIAEAFRAAHEADPDAILVYNDYNIELGYKRPKALELLKKLIEQKVPVHGVGIQSHWRIQSLPLAEAEEAIKQFSALGLKVMITELDIGVLQTRYQGADISKVETMTPEQAAVVNPYTKGLPDEVAREHAERYRQAFELFLRYKDVIGRVTLWGPHDGNSWLDGFPIRGRTDHPLLFDRQLRPKSAFFAVQKAAQTTP